MTRSTVRHIGLSALLGLGLLCFPLVARGQTETVMGADPSGAIFGWSGARGDGVGWSMNRSYSNVTVSARLANGGGPSAGIAYLMRDVGPGTTKAQEVIRRRFDLPLGFDGMFTLFSGLDLDPGRYWLIFWTRAVPVSYVNLAVGAPLSLSLATGSRYLGSVVAYASGYAAYPPASAFTKIAAGCRTMECLAQYGFVFRVTGTPANDAPVSDDESLQGPE